MSKNDRSWIPDAVDLDWIESLAPPLPPALAAIEAAAEGPGIPIVDRDAGRVLRVLAGDRRRIVEVGTAYGYSTLWMALGQPADGTIVTIDPDRERTDLARGWWRQAGIADERITVVNAPALDAIGSDPALEGPFDMVFIDALKPEYEAYLAALAGRLAAGRAHRRRQRPVERPGLRHATRGGRRREHRGAPGVRCGGPGRSTLQRHDPAGRRRPAHRHVARLTQPSMSIAVRVRLFAIQRELAGTREVPLELADGADVEAAWAALVARHPVLAPGRASLRFARNGDYADPTTALADGDEVAMIPPVSGGSGGDDDARPDGGAPTPTRILELRETPFTTAILAELADALAVPEDGAVVGFLGRTRSTPGTPAPGQEAEAARHAGRSVDSLEYEALDTLALRTLAAIADEIAARFGVDRLAIVHRIGEVPLGEPSIAVVAVAPHRDAAFDAARYAIDETKARAPIWKAERFADGHVWIGHQARTGPEEG